MYKEDASRFLNWFVTGNSSPECMIQPNAFKDLYGSAWSTEGAANDDIWYNFAPNEVICKEDNEFLKGALYDKDNIVER